MTQTHMIGIDAPDEIPTCPRCGQQLEWEECGQCDDGWFDAYEDDPMWYAPGDVLRCDQCLGHGGWWVCTNLDCTHGVVSLQGEDEP